MFATSRPTKRSMPKAWRAVARIGSGCQEIRFDAHQQLAQVSLNSLNYLSTPHSGGSINT